MFANVSNNHIHVEQKQREAQPIEEEDKFEQCEEEDEFGEHNKIVLKNPEQ